MSKDLRYFLSVVKEAMPWHYIETNKALDPKYEISIFWQKLAKHGFFPTLLCLKIVDRDIPLVTGLLASYHHLGLALGLSFSEIDSQGESIISKRYFDLKNKRISPLRSSFSKVQQISYFDNDIDLLKLPIPLHALLNPAPYITSGIVITKDPETKVINAGIYRIMVTGKKSLLCMILPSHDGYKNALKYAKNAQKMPVAIIIGHHPSIYLASCVPCDRDDSELEIMGAFLDQPVMISQGLTVDLPILSDAEIVIEGLLDPSIMIKDGPFSEGGGYYGEGRDAFPVEVTAITTRREPIYYDINPIHQEHMHFFILDWETNLKNNLGKQFDFIKNIHYGPDGNVGKLLAYISIYKHKHSYVDAKKVGLAALNSHKNIRTVIIVDEDVDVYNQSEVLWALSTRVRGDRDIDILRGCPGLPGNPLGYNDNDTGKGNLDTKIIIDATAPRDVNFPKKVVPQKDLWQSIVLQDYF